MDLDRILQAQLRSFEDRRRRRVLKPLERKGCHVVLADGRSLVDFSSNDFLGLSQHPLLKERAALWAERHGTGAAASRLVSGSLSLHHRLEERLAELKGTEAALLFASGYQANATVLPALAALNEDGEAMILADRLSHASIIHGARASGARLVRFRHNDLDHLAELLKRHTGPGLRIIATESVFSMDGDRCDLARLVKIAEESGALIYVDEAHATGILGPQGRGLSAALPGRIPVVMGTLGKALGGFGAFVAGSRRLVDYLINACSGFIYTTALPPPILGALDAALDLLPSMDAERRRVAENAGRLRAVLAKRGMATMNSTTQIVPALIGDEAAALEASDMLARKGLLAVAIRPPTVPDGTSRIRFSITAAHGEDEIQALLGACAGMAEPGVRS